MTNGGRRPGSGRHKRDTVRVGCSILRPVYLELVRQEKETGVYRCQIVERIVTAHLVGGIVERELAVCPRQQASCAQSSVLPSINGEREVLSVKRQ